MNLQLKEHPYFFMLANNMSLNHILTSGLAPSQPLDVTFKDLDVTGDIDISGAVVLDGNLEVDGIVSVGDYGLAYGAPAGVGAIIDPVGSLALSRSDGGGGFENAIAIASTGSASINMDMNVTGDISTDGVVSVGDYGLTYGSPAGVGAIIDPSGSLALSRSDGGGGFENRLAIAATGNAFFNMTVDVVEDLMVGGDLHIDNELNVGNYGTVVGAPLGLGSILTSDGQFALSRSDGGGGFTNGIAMNGSGTAFINIPFIVTRDSEIDFDYQPSTNNSFNVTPAYGNKVTFCDQLGSVITATLPAAGTNIGQQYKFVLTTAAAANYAFAAADTINYVITQYVDIIGDITTVRQVLAGTTNNIFFVGGTAAVGSYIDFVDCGTFYSAHGVSRNQGGISVV